MKSDISSSRTSVVGQEEVRTIGPIDNTSSTEPIEVANLLGRCRDDLISLDLVLGKIEAGFRIEIGQVSDQLVKIDRAEVRNSLHITNDQSIELAGDAIRRVTEDIESLCRIPASASVNEMLNTLQLKMVRCLKLLPYSNA